MAFSKMPDDIYNSKNYKVARMFEEHAKVSGYEATRLESVYNWSIVRQELRGELPQSTTVGQYMYGVSSGAKLSVDKNYIKRAKETGNVEVRPLHAVQKIGQYDNGKYFVEVAHLDIHGNIIERIRINCHHLVLSAGSMWTSKLLMKAKYSGSLPNLNDHVGKFWGNNGERVFLRMALPESTLKTQGGPPSVGSMFQKTPYGPASYEIATTAMPFELHAMCIAALGIPDGHGGFTYNPRNGKVLVRYPKSAHQGTVKRLAAGLKDWNRKTGGWLWDFDALSGAVTYHPLGGAVLGKACDYYGRVHGYPGLYVIDGALIPGSTACANPAWTVAAISERCLDHIIQNDFGK
jgi:cholesterol oxidase